MLSLRFAIACVVCLLAFLLSFGLMTRDYSEAMSTYNMNRTMHKNELLQITQPWRLGGEATVDRPLNVLNVLVKGVSGELTESVQLRGGSRLDFSQSDEENAVAALFPEVDYVFIVGIIMSLLALAFAYDAVAGERETGILKILMSYSIPRDRVILSKWIG
ncbi:MAG: ABC transporter permease subunit, partial [Candidatus Latescibacteria bacterium]|nr:ABC transporter permease subunit [Candidatus Latescibacterota bacterium]